MRIALFVFGVLEYSVALANALSKYCQVDFYCSNYYAKNRDSTILDVLDDKVNIIVYGDYRIRDIRNIYIYYKLYGRIKKGKYDLIHLQDEGILWLLMYRKMWKKIPLIHTVHDPYQHPGLPFMISLYQDTMQRIFVRLARKIIVHGAVLKNQFLTRYSFINEKDVVVLPHGDFSIYKYWEKRDNKKIAANTIKKILFFGTVRPNKGLEYLIKAEPIISKRLNIYKIIVAGKITYYNYKKYVKDHSKFEFFNEFIPNKDIYKYFGEASIVVLPYISATQSGIIPLAYAFGKPVVATRVGAIPEVVEEGKTGILVEPRNESALANAIIKILSDDFLLEEMSEYVKRYCEQNLSWDSIAKKTINVYNEILEISK